MVSKFFFPQGVQASKLGPLPASQAPQNPKAQEALSPSETPHFPQNERVHYPTSSPLPLVSNVSSSNSRDLRASSTLVLPSPSLPSYLSTITLPASQYSPESSQATSTNTPAPPPQPANVKAMKDKVKRVGGFSVGTNNLLVYINKYNSFLFRLLLVLELATGSFLIKWKVKLIGVVQKIFAKYIAPRNGEQLLPFR